MVCFSMSSVSIQCSVRKQYFIRVRRHCTNLLWIWSHRWVINSIYRHLLYHIVRYRWTFWTACGRSATTWIGLDALWTDCVSHDIQYVSSAQQQASLVSMRFKTAWQRCFLEQCIARGPSHIHILYCMLTPQIKGITHRIWIAKERMELATSSC